MNIFIVGLGKLANAILTSDFSHQSCGNVLKWDTKFQHIQEKAIVVHAGSGRQLQECIEFCSKTKSVLIELSTGLKTEDIEPDFPLIICPNTSMIVLSTLKMIGVNSRYLENYEISIMESHQSTKTTEAGTAIAFANALKLPLDKIKSIRDSKVQENEIKIPKEYLSKHAFHRIVIKDDDEEIIIETRILGHNSYAKGVKKIIEKILESNLADKKYNVWEII